MSFTTSQIGVLYRHGDVMIQRIDLIPRLAQRRMGGTLAYGEVTGHSHRFAQLDTIQLWVHGDNLWLEVKTPTAALTHEEHRQLDIPQGFYRVWQQREYRPGTYVNVED